MKPEEIRSLPGVQVLDFSLPSSVHTALMLRGTEQFVCVMTGC